jgi:stage II sporulation protein R
MFHYSEIFVFFFRRIALATLAGLLLVGVLGFIFRDTVSRWAALPDQTHRVPSWNIERLTDDSYHDINLRQDNLIRLHILANSDRSEDQELKYAVRDAVAALVGQRLAPMTDLNEARGELQASQDQIVACAEDVIRQRGYSYSVALAWDVREFPTRAYGNVTLPAGEYETVRLLIGEAEGANWWCVLFPPLCFVQDSSPEQDQKRAKEKGALEYAEVSQCGEVLEDCADGNGENNYSKCTCLKSNEPSAVSAASGSDSVQKRFFFMDFIKSLFG